MTVAVVGGGVVGMLSAYLLAKHGLDVVVLERQGMGSESSWAGGGIVSPLYPWRYNEAVAALAGQSMTSYGLYAEELLTVTGVDSELYACGLHWLDLDDCMQAREWMRSHGFSCFELNSDQLASALPGLGGVFAGSLFSPDLANIRNPKLLKALRAALGQMVNVRLLERQAVRGVVLQSGRVAGVITASDTIPADCVVVAAGAWSGELLATLGLYLPVEPVKGQMILYKCELDYLPAMVLAEGRYAIPRRDGHVLVGSTLEHVGFDKTPTGEARASLKASAEKMLPGLAQREVVGHWAGLRPGSPDGVPFIGEVPELPGLWLNCGHYRNGLVLAPASCELLKNLMLGETPIVDPAPYSPVGRLRAL